MTDDAMWNRVLALHGRIEHELARALQRRHGLGLSEYRALTLIAGSARGELRIQDLAGAIGLNQSSVSRMVARLEQAGLTRRDVCADDRRGVYSVITEMGRQRHASAAPFYREILTGALDRAGAERELTEVVKALRAKY